MARSARHLAAHLVVRRCEELCARLWGPSEAGGCMRIRPIFVPAAVLLIATKRVSRESTGQHTYRRRSRLVASVVSQSRYRDLQAAWPWGGDDVLRNPNGSRRRPLAAGRSAGAASAHSGEITDAPNMPFQRTRRPRPRSDRLPLNARSFGAFHIFYVKSSKAKFVTQAVSNPT